LVLVTGGAAEPESAGNELIQNQAPVTAFVDVHVVPLDSERILESSTVLVEADQIVALGPSGTVPIPDGATIIQGSGAYLIPGLADMHFHADARPEAFMLAVAYGITTVRNLNAEKGDLDLTRRVADGELVGPSVYNGPSIGGVPRIWMPVVYAYQFLISIAVGLAVLGILWLALLILRRRAAARKLTRARIPLGIGLLLAGAVATWLELPSPEHLIRIIARDRATLSPARAQRIVFEQRALGADFIKVNQFLPRDVFDAIVAAAATAGLPVIGHVSREVGLEHHLASGVEVQHTTEVAPFLSREVSYDDPRQRFDLMEVEVKLPEAVDLLTASGVGFTPTLSLYNYIETHLEGERFFALMGRPEIRLMPPGHSRSWRDPERNPVLRRFGPADRLYVARFIDVQNRLVREMSGAGVPILAGTDVTAIPGMVWGESLHGELELLVLAGLTPYQALVAATRAPARALGELEYWGTIEVGKQADLVLLEDNPLVNVSSTRDRVGVMLRGTWYERSRLEDMVTQIEASYAVEN
jgi:imidazolonepropionase-like amidohydrolase